MWKRATLHIGFFAKKRWRLCPRINASHPCDHSLLTVTKSDVSRAPSEAHRGSVWTAAAAGWEATKRTDCRCGSWLTTGRIGWQLPAANEDCVTLALARERPPTISKTGAGALVNGSEIGRQPFVVLIVCLFLKRFSSGHNRDFPIPIPLKNKKQRIIIKKNFLMHFSCHSLILPCKVWRSQLPCKKKTKKQNTFILECRPKMFFKRYNTRLYVKNNLLRDTLFLSLFFF